MSNDYGNRKEMLGQAKPFRARRKRDHVTDVDITEGLDGAAAKRAGGDAAAAKRDLQDLHRRTVETSGTGHPRLAPIDEAIEDLGDA